MLMLAVLLMLARPEDIVLTMVLLATVLRGCMAGKTMMLPAAL
jgi:hypothetical protein